MEPRHNQARLPPWTSRRDSDWSSRRLAEAAGASLQPRPLDKTDNTLRCRGVPGRYSGNLAPRAESTAFKGSISIQEAHMPQAPTTKARLRSQLANDPEMSELID